jgi:penicillin G amidase
LDRRQCSIAPVAAASDLVLPPPIGLRSRLDGPAEGTTMISDSALLDAMRARTPIADLARTLSTTPAELAAARDAWLARQVPAANARVTARVGAKVEILRDRAGVPHVYAQSTPDLYFGLGLATAQDRLWQIDRLRRRALGRQAEILGSAYLASDVAHLTVGIDKLAEREPSMMDGRTYEMVAAYVAGINRAIESMGKNLPVEFRLLDYAPHPFTVGDVVAIGRGIWWSLNGRIDRIMAAECARYMPEALRVAYLTPEAAENLVLPDGGSLAAGSDDATGSNNWAIAAGKSATGKTLLAGDPHQPFWVPSSWYEYGLHGPEDDCAGAGHPGFPGLWWGSNGTVAWCITNNMASTRDLYREQVDPADPQRYRDGDVWRRFESRELSIPVKGAAAHKLVVRATTRGPIVNGLVPQLDAKDDPPLSLRWVGHEHMDDIRASIGVGRAKDWKQFRAALSDWSVAVFNFCYADDRGNVGYQMAGRIPVRGRVHYGLRDANDPADRWIGYVPWEGMPHSYNPKRGYVASANQRIVPADYRHPIYGAYSQGHRGIRIDQAFAAADAGRLDATIALQLDVKSVRAERIVPNILRAIEKRQGPGRRAARRNPRQVGLPPVARQRRRHAVRDLHVPLAASGAGREHPSASPRPDDPAERALCHAAREAGHRLFRRQGHRRGGRGGREGSGRRAAQAAGRRHREVALGRDPCRAVAPSALERGERRGARHRAGAARRRLAYRVQHRRRAAAACRVLGRRVPHRRGLRRAPRVPRRAEHRQLGRARQPALPRPVRGLLRRELPRRAARPGRDRGGRDDGDHAPDLSPRGAGFRPACRS